MTSRVLAAVGVRATATTATVRLALISSRLGSDIVEGIFSTFKDDLMVVILPISRNVWYKRSPYLYTHLKSLHARMKNACPTRRVPLFSHVCLLSYLQAALGRTPCLTCGASFQLNKLPSDFLKFPLPGTYQFYRQKASYLRVQRSCYLHDLVY